MLTTRFTEFHGSRGGERKDWRARTDENCERRGGERRRGEQGGGGRGDSLTQGKEVAHRHAVCHLRATASSNDRSVPLLSRGYRRNDRVKDRARDSEEGKKKKKEKRRKFLPWRGGKMCRFFASDRSESSIRLDSSLVILYFEQLT